MLPTRNKQRFYSTRLLLAWILIVASVALVSGAVIRAEPGTDSAAGSNISRISVDYPTNGSVFPPDITAPTFLWHDHGEAATKWVIEISFFGRTIRRLYWPGTGVAGVGHVVRLIGEGFAGPIGDFLVFAVDAPYRIHGAVIPGNSRFTINI